MKTGTNRAESGKSGGSCGGCGGDRGPTGAAAALVPGGFPPPRAGSVEPLPGLSAAAERCEPCGMRTRRCEVLLTGETEAPLLPAWIGVLPLLGK